VTVEPTQAQHILVFGATGTIGRATVKELLSRGYRVTCFLRPQAETKTTSPTLLDGAEICFGDVTDPSSLANTLNPDQPYDAFVSCLASRTGAPSDAWAIDYQAHENILSNAQTLGVKQMVLLSAICVQKPRLAFQHAKLKFENSLVHSGLIYSIVRPTAYFKSLSGQIKRLQQGKPFLVFGDGTLTACKPLSDSDLAIYLSDCLQNDFLKNKILPIGGPGPAITPLEQGECLFKLLGLKPHFKHVPVSILSSAAKLLGVLGKVVPRLAVKAELARIGHYYATESMLLLNPDTNHYDANATPETGQDTLFEYYQRVLDGDEKVERGEHAVF
jgi:divinyl chlorophyllide a 8-vinyl-reductase